MADDKGGDRENEQTFETLHSIFTQHFSKSSDVRFEGYDTDGSFIWFNFQGPDEASVREAVLSHLKKYHLRHGSYFISNVTQACAAPNDGPTTLLGDLSAIERPPSFS